METLPIYVQILIYGLATIVIINPFCTFIHELGHTLVALILTNKKVIIQFGKKGAKRKIKTGRLTMIWHLSIGSAWALFSLEEEGKMVLHDNVWICMGGPFASLISAVMSIILALLSNWNIFLIILAYNFIFTVFLTMIPMHYPKWTGAMAGYPNDMLYALMILKNKKRY